MDTKTRCKMISAIIIGLLMMSSYAMAQTEEPTVANYFGVGARAMGMGGAFIGVADDFTAIHWNPAGLAQIKHAELVGGLSHTILDINTSFYGTEQEERESTTRPNSLGLVWPVRVGRGERLAFAFGVNRIQGFDERISVRGFDESDDPTFGQLDIDERRSNTGNIYAWSFGGAGHISRNITLGASFDFWDGNHFQELDVLATDTTNVDTEIYDFNFYDTTERDYWGFSGKIGMLAKLSKHVKIGAAVTVPMLLEVDENWTQDTVIKLDDGSEEFDSDDGYINYSIQRPFEFGGGIAVNYEQLLLAADLQYADWTQTEYSEPPAQDVSNADFDDYYEDTLQLRFGGEFSIPAIDSKVRAGYWYNPIAFFAEDVTDNRDFFTFGVGTLVDDVLELNLAYLLGLWEKSTDTGEQKYTSHQIFFSMAYRY